MSLKEQIQEHVKDAMRARDTFKLGVLRMLLAALKQKEVDERIELTDADVLAIVEKEIKKRKDALGQYEQAGREDLASVERNEIAIIQTYLPAQLSLEALNAEVALAIAEVGLTGPQAMGKVMALLKPKLAGRADMAVVSKLLKEKLQ